MLDRGWHSGPVFGTHSAAMAAGKLRGLAPAQLEDALGLAGTQSAGLMAAQYEAMSKRMHHGFAARNGFYAAGLAADGYTGIKRVFEREYGGFLSVFGEGHDPDASLLTGQLGQRWETTIIMVKSYAAMGGLHGAIDAARKMRRFRCARGYLEGRHHRRRNRLQARLVAAAAAADPDRRPDEHRICDGRRADRRQRVARAVHPARLDSDDIWSLIAATTVHLDESLAHADITKKFRTDVTVTTRDGAVHRARVEVPHGAPTDPVTNDELVAKFHALADRVTSSARADAIERAVVGLEDLDDVNYLIDLLAAPVAGALD